MLHQIWINLSLHVIICVTFCDHSNPKIWNERGLFLPSGTEIRLKAVQVFVPAQANSTEISRGYCKCPLQQKWTDTHTHTHTPDGYLLWLCSLFSSICFCFSVETRTSCYVIFIWSVYSRSRKIWFALTLKLCLPRKYLLHWRFFLQFYMSLIQTLRNGISVQFKKPQIQISILKWLSEASGLAEYLDCCFAAVWT